MKDLIYKFKLYGPKKFFSFAFAEIKNKIRGIFLNSFSQKGEDLEITKLIGEKENGIYVDVGANDPHRFSNTKKFYLKGWRGINIEPDPINYQRFVEQRPDDTNLNIGIGQEEGNLEFFRFDPDTLSTFSNEEADNYIKDGFTLKGKINVDIKPLSKVLDTHLNGKKIDFFSIDTEGFDMQVLQSNDRDKYSPTLICIESVSHSDGKNYEHEQVKFLEQKGYVKVYDNGLNSIYKLQSKQQ